MRAFNKKLLAGAVALALSATAMTAFARGGPNYDDPERFTYIFQQMELTQEQQQNVLTVMTAHQEQYRQLMWEQMQDLRSQEERPTRDQVQDMIKEHRQDQLQLMTDKLNTVLSPTQTQELVGYIEAHRGFGMNDDNDSHRGLRDGSGDGNRGNKGNSSSQSNGQGNK